MLCDAAEEAGEAGVDPQTGAPQGARGAADAARAPPGHVEEARAPPDRVLRLTFRGKIFATGVVDSDDAERVPLSKRRKSDLDEEVHVLRGRLGRGGR